MLAPYASPSRFTPFPPPPPRAPNGRGANYRLVDCTQNSYFRQPDPPQKMQLGCTIHAGQLSVQICFTNEGITPKFSHLPHASYPQC